LASIVALALIACDATATPSPSSSSVPAASTVASSTTSASAGLPITVGIQTIPIAPGPFFSLSNTSAIGFRPPGARPDLPIQLVYSALYRYNDSFEPVPDLAAEPCDISADGLTITCRLVETTFHDGTPLTADDVVYTYELASRQPDCAFGFGNCVGEMLTSVTARDPRTVEFQLSRPNATFLTLVLPSITIDSRAVIETAYAPLGERAPTLDAAAYRAAADGIDKQMKSEQPDCVGALEGTDELLEAAAIEPLPRDQFIQADGQFDPCLYAQYTGLRLRALESSLGASGLDAIAQAYRVLSFQRTPVGTGPFRFTGVTGGTVGRFEAFDGYHFGRPATPRIELRVLRDQAVAREQLLAGEIQWMTILPRSEDLADEVRTLPGIKVAAFPDATYTELVYNLREGRLFADPKIREALEMCIDKPQTVDTATHGHGQVIYSPIDPISWAFQPDLVRPERDVAAARRLIESSGWTAGADGIFVRDGRRLSTKVYVAGEWADRVEFLDIVAAQVRGCGIELNVDPADQRTVLGRVQVYPHIAPGEDTPFDALFFAWGHTFDPDEPMFHSRWISSPEQPLGSNLMGFSDPRVDELLDRGIATYDQRERARIYRQLQDELAAARPALFGWAIVTVEALDKRLTYTDGEPDLGSRQWYWQIEKLVLRPD
jgi:ABC-type transport system substrate-binding protein